MRGPISVRLLTVLALISIGAAVVIVALALVAVLVPADRGGIADVVRGALSALGYSHGTFGAYEFGEVFGATLFGAVPPLVVLLSIRRRRFLWLLRTATVLWLLIAVSNEGWPLLPLIAAILSFLPATRRFFRDWPNDEAGDILGDLDMPGTGQQGEQGAA